MKSSMFKAIQVQTKSGCNLKCPMCPNSYMSQGKSEMAMPLFRKIIAELAGINYSGSFYPYLMNEPLLDDRMVGMIRESREAMPHAEIMVSTNGVLLTDSIVVRFLKCGLSELRISCYSQDMLERWKDNKNVTAINMVNFKYNYNNRGGNIDVGSECIGGYCKRPFIQMYINSLGQAILCCSDYKFEVVLGDINNNTLSDVWNGDKYNAYRDVLKNGTRERLRLCSSCNYA